MGMKSTKPEIDWNFKKGLETIEKHTKCGKDRSEGRDKMDHTSRTSGRILYTSFPNSQENNVETL